MIHIDIGNGGAGPRIRHQQDRFAARPHQQDVDVAGVGVRQTEEADGEALDRLGQPRDLDGARVRRGGAGIRNRDGPGVFKRLGVGGRGRPQTDRHEQQ